MGLHYISVIIDNHAIFLDKVPHNTTSTKQAPFKKDVGTENPKVSRIDLRKQTQAIALK